MLVACSRCGKEFEAQRPTARYCTASCRALASREAKRAAEGAALAADATVVAIASRRRSTSRSASRGAAGTVEESVTRELGEAASTSLGRQALALARRMDANIDTGSALASLSKQLVILTAAAVREKAQVAEEDPVGAIQAQVIALRAAGVRD